jgi:hypothetical protein
MSSPFLRYEDGKISLDNKDLSVKSANLSIAPTLTPEKVYGDYDPKIAGARTEFINFSPTQNLKGTLDISFHISAETFAKDGTPNNIDRLFDIRAGMSEDAINTNQVGRYFFDNMYLKSFSFSLSPFSLIEANASYDIYGSIQKEPNYFFRKTDVNFAHSLKSFGEMRASSSSADNSINGQFEITSLSYNAVVNRKIFNQIRSSENTLVNTRPEGVLPIRVSVETIESEMTIEANDMIPDLNAYGDQQSSFSPEGIADSEIFAHLYSLQGSQIATFSSKGKIQSQSVSISENSHAKSNITIKEIIK